jgi:hypothetical protein
MSFSRSPLAVALLTVSAAAQSYFYDQPPAAGGGILRNSQLWIDPTGQNDSDNDAIAWEDFQLAQDAVVTSVRWWGESAPSLGFQVSFFHQDPNTVAVQPDMFAAGSGPIGEEVVTSAVQTQVSPGLYQFEANLATPVFCAANTRYFVSVVGRTPISYLAWRWASSPIGPNGTFWWQRGLHMYFHLGESRAVSLGTLWAPFVGAPACVGASACPCGNDAGAGLGCENSTGEGAVLVATGSSSVLADDLELATLGMPRNQNCLTFASSHVIAAVPFGDGSRCLAPPVSRFSIQSSGATGSAAYGPGLAAYSAARFPAANHFVAGSTFGFQTWYRDPNGPCGALTNVSSARLVAFTP